MHRLIVSAIAAAALCSTAVAAQEHDKNSDFCVNQTKRLIPIMEARQGGVPQEIVASASDDTEFKIIVATIYKTTARAPTAKAQKEKTKQFALYMYATCIEEMNEQSK